MIEDFDHILKTTRSVRRRLDLEREVPDEIIEACIEAAVQAPVGLGGENWRFLIVKEQKIRTEIANHYADIMQDLANQRGIEIKSTHRSLMHNLHDMPCLIFVFAIGEPQETIPQQIAFYGSILPAAWSLMLSLRARDLGSTWTTLLSARQKEISALLSIPDNVTHTVMLPVAYTKNAVLKPADRLSAKDVTFYNRWGEQKTTNSHKNAKGEDND